MPPGPAVLRRAAARVRARRQPLQRLAHGARQPDWAVQPGQAETAARSGPGRRPRAGRPRARRPARPRRPAPRARPRRGRRPPADRTGHHPPRRPPGERESAMGTPPDPRRTNETRRDGRAPLARVVFARDQPVVPGQQRRWRNREDGGPAPAGYERCQRGEPHPVSRDARLGEYVRRPAQLWRHNPLHVAEHCSRAFSQPFHLWYLPRHDSRGTPNFHQAPLPRSWHGAPLA